MSHDPTMPGTLDESTGPVITAGTEAVVSDDPTRMWPLCAVCEKTAREGNHCTDLGVGHNYVPSQVSGSNPKEG